MGAIGTTRTWSLGCRYLSSSEWNRFGWLLLVASFVRGHYLLGTILARLLTLWFFRVLFIALAVAVIADKITRTTVAVFTLAFTLILSRLLRWEHEGVTAFGGVGRRIGMFQPKTIFRVVRGQRLILS